MPVDIKSNPHADVVELADALASGASGSNLVRVQVPPSAPVSRLFMMFHGELFNLLSIIEMCGRICDGEISGRFYL